MERKEFQGAYLGFTYNNIHSSTFGIVRTSDGSRYNQNLLPTIQDKTIQISGRAGKALQDSEYDTRVFTIQIAYDALTEQQMQDMRIWLGDKKIHPLVFDETPYKTWYAKVTGMASMKWIPFSESITNRVYKGEGTIQFTCYDPMAHCSFDFDWRNCIDSEEWIDSSRLEERDWALGQKVYQRELAQVNDTDIYGIAVYNCGDMPADFILSITSNWENKKGIKSSLRVWMTEYDDPDAMTIEEIKFMSLNANSNQLRVNSKLNLVESYKQISSQPLWKKELNLPLTGPTVGSYFKIPTGKVYYIWAQLVDLTANSSDTQVKPTMELEYEYLYL